MVVISCDRRFKSFAADVNWNYSGGRYWHFCWSVNRASSLGPSLGLLRDDFRPAQPHGRPRDRRVFPASDGPMIVLPLVRGVLFAVLAARLAGQFYSPSPPAPFAH